MTSISIFESVILVTLCVLSFIVPIIVLILGYLIYNKLGNIEEILKSEE